MTIKTATISIAHSVEGLTGIPDSGNKTITPIHRLHRDVLVMILMTVRDATDRDQSRMWKTRPKLSSPTLFSHVCTDWRRTVLSTPLLWTTIRYEACQKNLDPVSAHLKLSQQCPIDVDLTATSTVETWSVEDMSKCTRQLYHVLADHLIRSRSIRIRVDTEFRQFIIDLLRFFSNFPSPLLHLRELHLEEFLVDHFRTIDTIHIFPGGMPCLENVRIATPASLVSFNPSCSSRITSLHLQAMFFTASEFRASMMPCDALQTLALYGDFKNDDSADWYPSSSVEPMEFPCLSTMLLMPVFVLHVGQYLRIVSAPRLRHLAIRPLYFGKPIIFPQDKATMNNFYGLKELTLGLDCMDGDNVNMDIRLVAELFPEVEVLTIFGSQHRAFVGILTAPDHNGFLVWPRLHTLTFEYCIGLRRLRKLTQLREAAGSPLKTIYLSNVNCSGKEDLAWVRAGLQVIRCDQQTEQIGEILYRSCHDPSLSDGELDDDDCALSEV